MKEKHNALEAKYSAVCATSKFVHQNLRSIDKKCTRLQSESQVKTLTARLSAQASAHAGDLQELRERAKKTNGGESAESMLHEQIAKLKGTRA